MLGTTSAKYHQRRTAHPPTSRSNHPAMAASWRPGHWRHAERRAIHTTPAATVNSAPSGRVRHKSPSAQPTCAERPVRSSHRSKSPPSPSRKASRPVSMPLEIQYA
ncbi:hypothetical protein [Melittangium boletus]|uniref:hypothetical protein n=1 Tax=Melittangium boletus TaxID=83453 RepID=UPI003DA5E770